MIYLDNAATTYHKPYVVKQEITKAINSYTANAGRGGHKLAQLSAEKIAQVREKVLKLFNTQNHTCIFTSGCSSALNLAILGSCKQGGHVITTYLEHNSVLRPLEYLKGIGKIDYTIVDKVDSETIESQIKPNTYMVITTQASNVTGERVDVLEINKVCKKYNLIHLVDTAQGAGHIFDDLNNIDMIAFAGHKGLYGLGGVGGLVVNNDIKLQPIVFGGTGTVSESLTQPDMMPEGFEVGTLPNIPIISLGAGIDYVINNKNYLLTKEQRLHNQVIEMFKNLNYVTTYYASNSVGVYSFNVGNLDSSFVSDYLNEKFSICTRSGLHCAPLVHKHFNTQNQGMVRVSLSADNTIDDIIILEKALKGLKQFIN
ncbi:MAG: aminotransferase class V-fold PLP-dependent enzyme [Clostridia bacterium]